MIISGKELSARLKADMRDEVSTFPAKYGRVPHLVVILVGDDPASISYVTGKAKASEYVGIKNTTVRKPATVTEDELLGLIRQLNADDTVDGILVQLPLPDHISEAKVIETIDKSKDVDGFHPLNVAALWQKQPCTLPCTPKGIIKMLKAAGVRIAGKRAVVIGRSNIVGLPVAKLLLDENATVTIAHSRTADLPALAREAEILVVAIGRPKFVTADMVSEGTVVVDVGEEVLIVGCHVNQVGGVHSYGGEPLGQHVGLQPTHQRRRTPAVEHFPVVEQHTVQLRANVKVYGYLKR